MDALRNEEATNIQIKTQLDCKEYIGNYPALQETDVPWRMMCLWGLEYSVDMWGVSIFEQDKEN